MEPGRRPLSIPTVPMLMHLVCGVVYDSVDLEHYIMNPMVRMLLESSSFRGSFPRYIWPRLKIKITVNMASFEGKVVSIILAHTLGFIACL